MDSTLTLLGSIVIGGVFLLGVMTFYGDVTEHSHNKTFELLTQETTAGFMEIIDHDFRRIGAGWSRPDPAIVAMGPTSITFYGDVTHDAEFDTVIYSLSEPSAAGATQNPNDRILYRVVNGVNTINTAAGVVQFQLGFWNTPTDTATTEAEVSMINVTLVVESPVPYDTTYARAIWRKRYTPNNLIRRPYEN